MDDCEFVANLRSIPAINKFLSNKGEISLEQQEKWLVNFLRTSKEYYFIIIDAKSQKKTGTISLYNIEEHEKAAEFGRYICINNLNAIESELMILKFAFNVLKLKKIYCKTVEENAKVWSQHYKYGFDDKGFEYMDNEKKLNLRVQEISSDKFNSYDYRTIINIINKFS